MGVPGAQPMHPLEGRGTGHPAARVAGGKKGSKGGGRVLCGAHSLYLLEQIGRLLGYSPRLHGTSARNVKMLRGAGPKARPRQMLVSHAPSEPRCSLPGGGGGWVCKIPLGQQLSGRIFPWWLFPWGPVAACNGEEHSLQLPLCSLPPVSVGTIPMDPTSPLLPLDAPPVLKTPGGVRWVGELPPRWRVRLLSCW